MGNHQILCLDSFQLSPVHLLANQKYPIIEYCRDLLSSREVEGNGPMKPDNPLATSQEGCQFRRSNPQDEGEEVMKLTPYILGGQLHITYPVNVQGFIGVYHLTLKNRGIYRIT